MSRRRRPKTRRSVPLRDIPLARIESSYGINAPSPLLDDALVPVSPEMEAAMQQVINRYEQEQIASITSRALDTSEASTPLTLESFRRAGEQLARATAMSGSSFRELGEAMNRMLAGATRVTPEMLGTDRSPARSVVESFTQVRAPAASSPPSIPPAPPRRAATPQPVQPGAPAPGRRKVNLDD